MDFSEEVERRNFKSLLAQRGAKVGGFPGGGANVGGGPGGGIGGGRELPHLLGGILLLAPQRDCLLEVIELEEPPGLLCSFAPGPAGFFLKSFISLSMLLYVLGPHTKPSGETPIV